jgi:hypothetical protein
MDFWLNFRRVLLNDLLLSVDFLSVAGNIAMYGCFLFCWRPNLSGHVDGSLGLTKPGRMARRKARYHPELAMNHIV